MKFAEKVQRYKWAILIVAAAFMFGALCLYAFIERARDIRATVETIAAEEVSYLLKNLNTHLLSIASNLPDGHYEILPDSQAEHLFLTGHLVETNPFVQTMNFIGPDHRIKYIVPFESNSTLVGTGIKVTAPEGALEMAASSKELYFSKPFEVTPGAPGYSLIIPVRNDGFFLVVFTAESVFGNSSLFRPGGDVLIRVSDDTIPVFTPEGYQNQLTRVRTHQMDVEGALLNRLVLLNVLPSDALLNSSSRFWQAFGISSLTVSFVLLLAIIFAQILAGKRRKRVEEELKLEARLLDSATDSVFLCDLGGNLTYANEMACRSYGYSRDEFLEMNIRDLDMPENIEVVESARQALQASDEVTMESIGLRKDGETFPVEVHARIIEYADKKLILSVARDITERNLAREALKESEERYRAIFDNSRDGIVLVDRNSGSIVECNRAFELQTGRTLDQLRLMKIWDVRPEDRIEAARQKFQDISEEGTGDSAELDFQKPDGQTLPVEFASRSVEIGGRQYLQSMVRDITEARQMAETVKLAYAELERIFNATADGMCVIDREFNVIRVNDAYASLSGAGKQRVLGRKCYESMGNQLCHTPRCPLTRIIDGEDYIESEVENERSDGTKLTCILTATPLLGPDGELTGIIKSLKDTTELRKAREQLQHSQLLASLGEMTAGIAHEVNNPLGSVLLYSELLMTGDISPQTKIDLKIIHDEAKRAARIMTDLLTYSRKVKYQVRRLDLHRILNKLLDMRRYTERVHNITVSTDFAQGPLWVRGDSSQLKQLFMNLMLNAEEAVKESGNGHIQITTLRDTEWVSISVSDNGTGIPPENLRQVFYPFFTTRDVGEGTGLGLSTCYGIVTNHNGLIRAENNETGGATFIVELPLAQGGKQRSLIKAGREAD
jgi:PAS domain S-box-containing protein